MSKVHKVIFVDGPMKGKMLDVPKKLLAAWVLHTVGIPAEPEMGMLETKAEPLVIFEAEPEVLAITSKDAKATRYYIAALRGDKECWFVATVHPGAKKDCILGRLFGGLIGAVPVVRGAYCPEYVEPDQI